jgi:hypothetical protein
MAANSFFTSKTIRRNVLLRAFPQNSTTTGSGRGGRTGLVYGDLPLGKVKSHALEITLTQRYTNGLSANASFSATRTRENRTVEEYDRAPTLWQGSNGSRPYRITMGAVYELPFGGGRSFLNSGGLLGAVVGGWQMAGTFEYQPGALLNWGNLFFYGDLKDIAVDNPTLDRWFNVDAGFERNPSKTPAAFQKRSFPYRVDGVRGYDVMLTNLNLSRTIPLGGTRSFQVRMDIQNLFNRQHYRDPNLTPTSTDFGKITSVASSTMRFFTFGGRFSF